MRISWVPFLRDFEKTFVGLILLVIHCVRKKQARAGCQKACLLFLKLPIYPPQRKTQDGRYFCFFNDIHAFLCEILTTLLPKGYANKRKHVRRISPRMFLLTPANPIKKYVQPAGNVLS